MADSPREVIIQQGKSISRIAAESGLTVKTIWEAPENAELRAKRSSPHILQPGDRLVVPAKELREESVSTESRHRFRRKGVPIRFRLALVDEDGPRSDLKYLLEVDGKLIEGKTDGEGLLEHLLPPTARRGTLTIDGEEKIPLVFGKMDPVEEISGVQARLNNLGYGCGEQDDVMGPQTEAALKAFQKEQELEVTGKPDDATRAKLVELHGS